MVPAARRSKKCAGCCTSRRTTWKPPTRRMPKSCKVCCLGHCFARDKRGAICVYCVLPLSFLLEMAANKSVTLNVANSIWGNDIKKEFDALMTKFFQARAFPLTTAAEINRWCAQQTSNKITGNICEK